MLRLTFYEHGERELENHAPGKERKLSSVRTMFRYLFKREMISSNVASLVDLPKKREKPIIRLEPDEVARLLDTAETGGGLSERQRKSSRETRPLCRAKNVRPCAVLKPVLRTMFLRCDITVWVDM